MIIVKYISEFLWSCWGQCGVSSISDSSLFQFIRLLKVCRPLPVYSVLTPGTYSVASVTSRAVPGSLFWLSPLQVSPVSNFRPDTRGPQRRHKVAACSAVLWGGRSTASITGECGERSQCLGHTGCVLSWSIPTRLQVALQGKSKAGPGLHALPRSKLLRLRFSGTPQRRRLGWACVLCPSQVQAAQEVVFGKCTPPAGWWVLPPPWSQLPGFLGAQWKSRVSPLGSRSLSATLLADVNRPGSQEDLVTGSLLTVWWRMRGRDCPLPLCLWQRGGASPQPACSLLVIAQSFVLPVSGPGWNFSLSLSLISGCPTVWVAVSLELPQIVLRAFRPGPHPVHACAPCSPAHCWRTPASGMLELPLGV